MSAAPSRSLGPGDRLVIATHNAGKLREIGELLEPFGVETVSAGDLKLAEPEETGDTFEANALLKADLAARASGLPALADDSGFCVSALDGRPGIYSARLAGPNGDFKMAMEKLHKELGDAANRAASFVCALSLAWPDGAARTFRGEVLGTVAWPPRGSQGFGYDPMFQAEGHNETFGEMAPGAKHAISHRAHAFRQFVDACIRS